jgi:hypothetical protein
MSALSLDPKVVFSFISQILTPYLTLRLPFPDKEKRTGVIECKRRRRRTNEEEERKLTRHPMSRIINQH